jgi:uncharacterized protein YutE (UPF0331/DUF86 family)
MEFNRELIKKRAIEVKRSQEELGVIASRGREKFLSDHEIIDSVKYKLLVAIEASLSICNHIAARYAKKVPESYAECFLVLADSGIISKELSERLARMADFRDMLVHRYWEVDNEKLFSIIKDDLGDLEEFVHQVIQLSDY